VGGFDAVGAIHGVYFWYESIRYFAREESGKSEGKLIVGESREWANKALQKEDMEVWMFRLLLKYFPY